MTEQQELLIEELLEENRLLKKDKARLDFLEKYGLDQPPEWILDALERQGVRQAIDLVMGKHKREYGRNINN